MFTCFHEIIKKLFLFQFWRELQLERSWRSNQNNSQMNNSNSEDIGKNEKDVNEMFQLRDKSASFGNSIATPPSRPATCMPFTKDKVGNVKFDLPKLETLKHAQSDKIISEEKDKSKCDNDSVTPTQSKHDSVSCARNSSFENIDMNSNGNVKLSISELNKLKRDAFFNNMDCSQNDLKKEEEVKSEDLPKASGKVLQLIGSFERKEIEQKPVTKPKPEICKKPNWDSNPWKNREKSRLDKSSSTPAYDLSENDTPEPIPDLLPKNKTHKNLSDDEVLEQKKSDREMDAKFESEKENHGQMVNTINNHLLPDGDFYGKIAPKQLDDDSPDFKNLSENMDTPKTNEYKNRKKMGEILDTVNLALVELKEREDHYERREQLKEANQKIVIPTPREMKSNQPNQEINKPVPAQRKTKMPNDRRESPSPLPPKPRPRPLPPLDQNDVLRPPLRNRTPPEPPPRPESTFSKPPACKRNDRNEEAVGNDSRKGSIISIPVPISPISITPPIYEAGNRTNEMKHSPSLFLPERSTIKSTGSPLLGRTTPVLSVTTEKEKHKTGGGTLESFKAILTLGRKPASFNSPRSIRKKNTLLASKFFLKNKILKVIKMFLLSIAILSNESWETESE